MLVRLISLKRASYVHSRWRNVMRIFIIVLRIPTEDIPIRVIKRIVRIQITQTVNRTIVQIPKRLPRKCTTSPYVIIKGNPLLEETSNSPLLVYDCAQWRKADRGHPNPRHQAKRPHTTHANRKTNHCPDSQKIAILDILL